jgi:hypothetical protein
VALSHLCAAHAISCSKQNDSDSIRHAQLTIAQLFVRRTDYLVGIVTEPDIIREVVEVLSVRDLLQPVSMDEC